MAFMNIRSSQKNGGSLINLSKDNFGPKELSESTGKLRRHDEWLGESIAPPPPPKIHLQPQFPYRETESVLVPPVAQTQYSYGNAVHSGKTVYNAPPVGGYNYPSNIKYSAGSQPYAGTNYVYGTNGSPDMSSPAYHMEANHGNYPLDDSNSKFSRLNK
jgi:hypothetical protein